MIKKKGLKKVVAGFVVASSVLVTNFASAGVWSSSLGWTSVAGSYSPYWGNTSFFEENNATNGHYLQPHTRFKFNQSAVNAIKNYKNDPYGAKYYTFDISITDDYNTSMNGDVTKLYSTLPNPYYDVDDDPEPVFGTGGNGYNDETEVVSLYCDQIAAETDYRFQSWFKIVNNSQVQIAFTSAESRNDGYEFNTVYYDEHLRRSYTPQL
ncbi:hypothetical protein [Effusibacillus consociatus]|uniref:Uncharacterized protein n=1 Tax=Effusibacillus consociatus TaxID=1117041 RepID=A0ABV9Q4A4_9BACL